MSLFMCQIARRFLLQRLKGSTSGDARDFSNIERWAAIKLLFSCKARCRRKFTPFWRNIRGGGHAPSYATVEIWVAQFKRGEFSTCDAPCPGRPKTVTTPEIIDQIHELILEYRRILAKSIAEQLDISRERVGSIIHEDWVPKCLNADQKRQWCQPFWASFGIFSARSKWFPVGRDWWPWTKPGYITMILRQSNNQWSGGIKFPPAPNQKIPSAKIRCISSRLDFFGLKTAFSSLIIFQRAILLTRSIIHLCWCN